ncbi:hypothetical protein [Kitasatospora sp. NPDC096204]|uniref:hypothetical protein n=1 Tax=Kitasatospora sp. NPDC096204 TaxID=3364094 RepID=UPI00382244C1
MKAVTVTGSGGPEVLRVAEVPDPEPGPGKVPGFRAPGCQADRERAGPRSGPIVSFGC